MRTVAVIMAGGKGERSWPRSTASMPKEFLQPWGDGPLLRQAFERALKVTNDVNGVYVVTGPDYGEFVLSHLQVLGHEALATELASGILVDAGQRITCALMAVVPDDYVVLDARSRLGRRPQTE